jgi:hypothetical protein
MIVQPEEISRNGRERASLRFWIVEVPCGMISFMSRESVTMIELTEQQRQEVGETAHPIRVIDPATKREFFLVRAELFASLQSALNDLDVRNAYPAIDRAFAQGWDDPKMSDYDNYEQQKR